MNVISEDAATEMSQRGDDGGGSVTVLRKAYREGEIETVTSALASGAALLAVAAPGLGLSTLAAYVRDELQARGLPVVLTVPTTVKQMLLDLCAQLGLEAGRLTAPQLQALLSREVRESGAVLLFDNAQSLPSSIRGWLAELLAAGVPMALFAAQPPRKDLFLKLPRIELKPLPHAAIREVMAEAGREMGRDFTPAELASMAERAGGNPMLARRVVKEEVMGLPPTSPDHTQWIDGTPLLLAALMIFTLLRFIGRGMNSSDLYLIGGGLAVVVGVVRVLMYSMPRQSSKLG